MIFLLPAEVALIRGNNDVFPLPSPETVQVYTKCMHLCRRTCYFLCPLFLPVRAQIFCNQTLMASFVTAVLKSSIGALISKGRSMAAEKLKDGDVTDAKLRQLIVKDMDYIKSKLEGISVKDLGASISFFNDGVVYLDKVLDKEGGLGTAEKNEVKTEADGATKEIKVKENDIVPLVKGVKSLNLVGLNEDAKSAIKQAEKRFEDARRKAIEAFSNPALSTADRLLAMAIRIMATVLEQVANPVSALDSLRYCLEELHSLSAVQGNFSVLLKKGFKSIFGKDQRNEIVAFVCQMNRIIYDFTHEFVEDGRICRQLFLWPSVEVGGEKIDLLRDERIAKELLTMGMRECCVQPWSFGLPSKKNLKLTVEDIAINTKGHFIIVFFDEVMLFDSGGNFLHSFPIPNIALGHCGRVETDQADNVYVLVRIGTRDGYVYIFDAQAKLHHSFKTMPGYTVRSLMVESRGNVLVSMTEGRSQVSEEMYYYAHKDRFKKELTVQVFSKNGERLNSVDVLCHHNSSCLCTIRKGRVLVLDDKDSILHSVGIEDNVDHKKKKILLQEGMRPRYMMKFHQPSELLFILSAHYGEVPRVSIYSKDGEYLRTILLNVGCEFKGITAFAVTNDGHFALGLFKSYKYDKESMVCVI
ncbi:uncharacterized protein [Montipora capricornis]|uniref:uncharacterized protein n=1 Tax=Montipora capricornis TaxID=246305 RepID=UPI0035F21A3C